MTKILLLTVMLFIAASTVDAAVEGTTHMTLPNVWGKGGQLFAFSGMDGDTDVLNQLVGSSLPNGRGFLFHTKPVVTLSFAASVNGEETASFKKVSDAVVAGDVVTSTIAINAKNDVELSWIFLDKDTVLVKAKAVKLAAPFTAALRMDVPEAEREARGGSLSAKINGRSFMIATSSQACAVDIVKGQVSATLSKTGESALFVFLQASEGEDIEEKAARGLKAEFDIVYGKRLDFFKSLPDIGDGDQARCFAKCASVMKVNCLSPQDKTRFPWTTPDRWPHVHMWIWDSGFHGIGLRHFAPEWAENAIKAVLSRQHADGFIPHMMPPDTESNIIQPPVLGWCAWKVYEKTCNRGFIEYCYPRIVKMIEWDLKNRDKDGNGLCEWEEGGASGMDNSPRFDSEWKDGIDLNCFIANDMQYLSQMAVLLNKKEEAEAWHKRRNELVKLINHELWDEKSGFYYDNALDGKLIKIKTEAGFTPLLAGICSKQQAEALVKHLTDPDEFQRVFPVSSVSGDEPTFSDNMWRGPVWINYNYMIIEGLERYEYHDLAEELRRKTIDEIMRWYKEDGVIYEYYDSEGTTSPIFLHRKKLGGPEVKRTVSLGTTICDYNWTAALFIDMVTRKD